MKMKSIIKIAKRQSRFTTIDNHILQNVDLTYKARGILAYLMTRPPNWTVKMTDIVERSPEGRTSIQSGMKELIKHGYARLETVFGMNENGKQVITGKRYVVFEEQQLVSDKQQSRLSENLTDGKSDKQKTRSINKEREIVNTNNNNKGEKDSPHVHASILGRLFSEMEGESFFKKNKINLNDLALRRIATRVDKKPSSEKIKNWFTNFGKSYILKCVFDMEVYFSSAKGANRAKKIKDLTATMNNWIKRDYVNPEIEGMREMFRQKWEAHNGVKLNPIKQDKMFISISAAMKLNGSKNVTEDFGLLLDGCSEFWKAQGIKAISNNISTIIAEVRNGKKKANNGSNYASVDISDLDALIGE